MRRALTALAGSLAVVAGLAACSSRSQTDLRLNSFTPKQGTAAQPIQAEIGGQGLQPLSQTDFQKSGQSSLNARFQASLTKSGGTNPIPLADVTLTARHTLTATIPANLDHGDYDLTVTDPAGRTAQLLSAFQVVTPAEAVTGFRVDVSDPTQFEGVAFTVTVTAVDDTGQVADGFTGQVSVSDVSGTVTPVTLGPFGLGRFQGQVVVSGVIPRNTLTVRDTLGNTGESAAFEVKPGPAVQLAFASAPVSVAAGQCSGLLTLESRDMLGVASAVTRDVLLQLRGSTSGSLVFYPDAACTSAPITTLTIAAGQTTGAFAFKAGTASSLTLRVDPDTFPSVEQVETVH
jgi:hypothetical protein